MLLKGHDLEGVVAELGHLGKDVPAEVLEGGDLLFLGAHTDMALINEGMGALPGALVLPDVRLGRIPDLGAEDLGVRVLNAAGHIGGQPLSPAAGPLDEEFVQHSVRKEHARNGQFPVAAADRVQGVGVGALPVVAFADQVDPGGVGRPFPQHPSSLGRLVKAVVEMIVDGIVQGLPARELLPAGENRLVPAVNRRLERHQVWI